MQKHAYLIIAHHEFLVLERLISLLDDIRNDIYIHFDRKVKVLPTISTKCAKLFILTDRIDVRWGDISQIKCELFLFQAAWNSKNNNYSYFHLISGVHIPLKSQNEIHLYFDSKFPNNIFSVMPTSAQEDELKLRRFNFLTRFFVISGCPFIQTFMQFLWKILIRAQKIMGITRNAGIRFIKASNWVSLSKLAVNHLVNNADLILAKYKYTLCGDEYFVPSELNHVLPEQLIFEDHYLLTEFSGENPKIFGIKDYEKLVSSPYLFARKFSHSDLTVVDKICKNVKSKI